ncbi:MAG: hypothetical protein VX100_18940 [Pseudomonadota bacterium]|nr:hypothetical protein [Pseudomonadota bacterium]
MKEKKQSKLHFSQDKVNLFLALCAIIISAASFYATFLQANAAEKQVKAATWPWMQFVSGNANMEKRSQEITFTLKNSGAGPALVKYLKYTYQGKEYYDVYDFITACCFDIKAYETALQELQKKSPKVNFFREFGWITTSFAQNALVPPGGSISLLALEKTKYNEKFWQILDKKRFKVKAEVCYCSILENCYISNGKGDTQEVEVCPAIVESKPIVITTPVETKKAAK